MRKYLVLGVLACVVGCQNTTGPFASKSRDRDRRAPDPLLSPDLDEQQKAGRARFSYIEDDRSIAPPGLSGRSSPSGR